MKEFKVTKNDARLVIYQNGIWKLSIKKVQEKFYFALLYSDVLPGNQVRFWNDGKVVYSLRETAIPEELLTDYQEEIKTLTELVEAAKDLISKEYGLEYKKQALPVF